MANHYAGQLRELKDEEALKDVKVSFGYGPSQTLPLLEIDRFAYIKMICHYFRNSDTTDMANSFILSLMSPVFLAKVCCPIGTGEQRKHLLLEAEDASIFSDLMTLGVGSSIKVQGSLSDLIRLGKLADYLQMNVVASAVESSAIK